MAFIYIAQGEGGLLKVGMTSALSKRKSGLRREFRERGDVLIKVQQLAEVEDEYARGVEYRVIRHVHALGGATCSGREWLRGVGFDEVLAQSDSFVKEAIRVTKKFHMTPEQCEALRLEHEKRKAAIKESRRVRLLEREAMVQKTRFLRSGPNRCFEYIACAALNGVSSLDLPRHQPPELSEAKGG